MSEAALSAPQVARPRGVSFIIAVVAWRNLWRNKRRTWLTVGGIAFALLLVVTAMSLQTGMYGGMADIATRLGSSHLQVQHPEFLDNPRVEHTVQGAIDLAREIERIAGVTAVTTRTESFALVSADERSFGALVMGVEPEREALVSDFPSMLSEGEYLTRRDHAYVGTALARNLGATVGDEIVVLGSSKNGSMAAMVLTIGGTFTSGVSELDRNLLQVPLTAYQEAYEFGDEVHRVMVATVDANDVTAVVDTTRAVVPIGLAVRDWDTLMPEVKQAIAVDRIGGQMMYATLIIIVVLSIVNTFIMTVFERTREFGMLVALGMRARQIIGMLLFEAFSLWLVGAIVGVSLSLCIIVPTSAVGVPIAGLEEMAAQMRIPTRLYPGIDASALMTAPIIIGIGTLLAAWLPALRIRNLKPVDALREEE